MTCTVDYTQLDAIGLAALISRREVTPLEALDEAIARTEALNPTINAITLPLFERARAAAKAPLPAGPLAGVPFLLKDLGALLTGTFPPARASCSLASYRTMTARSSRLTRRPV